MSEVELDHIENASVAQSFADICRVMEAALNSGLHRSEFWDEFTSRLRIAQTRVLDADAQLVESSTKLIDESMKLLTRSARPDPRSW